MLKQADQIPTAKLPDRQTSVHTLRSGAVREVYGTCTLTAGESPEELFGGTIDDVLAREARICRQRVFVPAGQLKEWRAAHRRAFGQLPHQVPTQWLEAGANRGAIQLYGVAGAENWTPLVSGESIEGWAFAVGERRYAVTTGIRGRSGKSAAEQAREAFLAGESLLAQAGMSLNDVARTWIYCDDILGWYGELNAARNQLFAERGLLRRGISASESHVPASTGMGVSPADGAKVTIEFCAAQGAALERLPAAGVQRAAFEYGSAFSRAAEMQSPAGHTLFVSGTAAIAPDGQTCCPGDAAGQIDMTLENVCAVLKGSGYGVDSVVEAIAYCKNMDVVRLFRSRFGNTLPWPWVVVVGDICRSDLLFEVEATAGRAGEEGPCV